MWRPCHATVEAAQRVFRALSPQGECFSEIRTQSSAATNPLRGRAGRRLDSDGAPTAPPIGSDQTRVDPLGRYAWGRLHTPGVDKRPRRCLELPMLAAENCAATDFDTTELAEPSDSPASAQRFQFTYLARGHS